MSIHIEEVSSHEALLGVGRLRYAVYVEELSRRQLHADHRRRTIVEPLDAVSHVLAAYENGEVVGTVRCTPCAAAGAAIDYYRDVYQLESSGAWYPARVGITTKFLVAPRLRRSNLALRLARAAYAIGLAKNIWFDFIDCKEPLIPFFTRLGFRQTGPRIVHGEYGEVWPMVLSLRDYEYLRQLNSPLLGDNEPPAERELNAARAQLAEIVGGGAHRHDAASARVFAAI